jgi:hypothetical protein
MNNDIFGRPRPNNLHPHDAKLAADMIIGDHSRDKFKPPQVVADEEEQTNNTAGKILLPEHTKKHSVKDWWQGLNTKQKALFTGGAALVVAGAIIGSYFLFFQEAPKAPVAQTPTPQAKTPEAPPAPTTVASNLSGLQVEPAVNDRPVTAIMIENSMDARPQSGLNQASVVFEAVAEGGITRFLTLFQDTAPDYIGPVRSVRPYYIQWALGFDAAIAHAGGSAQALTNLQQWGAKDLNHSSDYFWRVDSRAAPHNLYTSIAKLREYEAKKGYGKAAFTALVRKAESPAATPTARSIDFNISSATFNVHYDYDTATNSYKRSEGGKPHTDQKSGAQLTPKTVVALVMPQGKNDIYTTYQTIGSGAAFIFQDGTVTQATWHKDSNTAQFTFTDASGQALGLNPGQTWFTALGGSDRVIYKP